MSREEMRSSMSPDERARRRAAVGKAASEKISKSEQLNFRIEEQSISELQEMALRKGMPVGTMIRDWVLERLSREKLGTPDLTGRALHVLDELHTKLNVLFGDCQSTSQVVPTAPQSLGAAMPPPLQSWMNYPVAMPAVPEPCPLPASQAYPCSAAADATSPDSQDELLQSAPQLDHFRAWEHLLTDQLTYIRHQREEIERAAGRR